MKDTSHKKHLTKAITWRIIGTLDTVILSWIITGEPIMGLQIGMAEVFTKTILYYLHERIWYKTNLTDNGRGRRLHVFKTFSWRAVGTMDTIFLAWIISGNPMAGLKIGMAEVITKMILYYLHERAWYRIDPLQLSSKTIKKI